MKVVPKVEYIYLCVHSTVRVVKDQAEKGSYNIFGVFAAASTIKTTRINVLICCHCSTAGKRHTHTLGSDQYIYLLTTEEWEFSVKTYFVYRNKLRKVRA